MMYSVIIPCYNCAEYLSAELDSLTKQDFTGDWEVIVVDNGSSDQPLRVVEQYRKYLPALQFIEATEKQGPSYARNRGCDAAKGDILLFCDGDDEVVPGWLTAMHHAMLEHDFVTGPVEYQKLNPKIGGNKKIRTTLRVWKDLPFLPHALGGNMGIRRKLHEAVGGFDETLKAAEDIDYSWRVQLSGIELHFVPDAIVHYRLRDSLSGNFTQFVHNGEFTVKLYKKFLPYGIEKKTWKDGLRSWKALLRQSRMVFRKNKRAIWIRHFGHAIGRLKGSIKYRVLFI